MRARVVVAPGVFAGLTLILGCQSSPLPQSQGLAANETSWLAPVVSTSARNGVSRPLRSIVSAALEPEAEEEMEENNPPEDILEPAGAGVDPVVQSELGGMTMPGPIVNVPGVGIASGPIPPD